MFDLKFLATGTGRCGTLFVANFLTSAGIPCTHEAVFTTKGIDHAFMVLSGHRKALSSKVSKGDNLSNYEMYFVGESSYMSAPFLKEYAKPALIHIVRNPLDVVDSFLRFGYFSKSQPSSHKINKDHILYEEFMYSHLSELEQEMPPLDRACLYWVGWNQMIEERGKVSYRHRIEDSVEGLSRFIGAEGTYCNKKCNPGPVSDKYRWTPAQIQNPSIRRRLKDMAKKYGYLSILH